MAIRLTPAKILVVRDILYDTFSASVFLIHLFGFEYCDILKPHQHYLDHWISRGACFFCRLMRSQEIVAYAYMGP